MILFNTPHHEFFNHIIHNFLKIEVFNGEEDIKEYLDFLVLDYLMKEQPQKCEQTLQELYTWTQDNIPHEMQAFHEYVLGTFLKCMDDFQNDEENFIEIYFDKKSHQMIQKICKEEAEEISELTIEELKEIYYNVHNYFDQIFDDMDFELLDQLQKLLAEGRTKIIKDLGINMDYYFELLPRDIQKQYRSSCITITGEIGRFIRYLKNRVNYGSLSNLFWEKEQPVNFTTMQIIFDNILLSYYKNREVDLFWNVFKTKESLNYEIYKRREKDKTVLVEIKQVKKEELKPEYKKRLHQKCEYYENVFYIFLCFNDEDYQDIVDFISKYIYTPTVYEYLNIYVFDLRKKKPASKSYTSF